jgi:hypothetical protein
MRWIILAVTLLWSSAAHAVPAVYNLGVIPDGLTCLANYQTFDVSPRNCVLTGSPPAAGYSGWSIVTLQLEYVGTLATCLGYTLEVVTDSNDTAAAFPGGWAHVATQTVVGGVVTIQPMVITRAVAAGGPVDFLNYSFAVDYRRLGFIVRSIGVCGVTDGLRVRANVISP